MTCFPGLTAVLRWSLTVTCKPERHGKKWPSLLLYSSGLQRETWACKKGRVSPERCQIILQKPRSLLALHFLCPTALGHALVRWKPISFSHLAELDIARCPSGPWPTKGLPSPAQTYFAS